MYNRRQFLRNTAAATAAFSGLAALSGRARADNVPLAITPPDLVPDPAGLLDLPPGFSYSVISTEGDEMDDGLLTPGDFDGMAAFETSDGLTLVRNHELHPFEFEKSPFGPEAERLGLIDPARLYDRRDDGTGLLGGTSTLVLDPVTLELKQHFLSLGGTYNNCAGGPTPWGSWLTCEETVDLQGDHLDRDHGYVFEVPAVARELVRAEPLVGLGRFRHEAVAIDPGTGITYLTEDEYDNCLFYRFIPDRPGELQRGGRLQALKIRGQNGFDTRNWDARNFHPGDSLPVEWMEVEDSANPDGDIALRHIALGAAQFTRGEGIWFGENELYFTCTDGGSARQGQIFRYIPSPHEGTSAEATEPARLELFIESPGDETMGMCDNITIAPWGDLIVAEDGRGEQYIRGVTPAGRIYTLARNAFTENSRYSEFCGPCFSPDGTILFVNVQSEPSRTFAVRGPWHELG
ncbi:alkaline phosphatase PhoX [Hyphobacterium indicum]|uniref:alkaline phosphatase PhoX n=1 Tax=Hyphobacterium indicum TaxID=2162714 RepID=UPI000D65485B|nr:alkaline phosphatase PhoX [Hyphobacterium indicum]